MLAGLFGAVTLISASCTAFADDTAEDLKQLRAAIQKELGELKKREQKLHQEFLRLDQKSQLLDEQLRKLRAAGTGGTSAAPSAAAPVVPPTGEAPQPLSPQPGARSRKHRRRHPLRKAVPHRLQPVNRRQSRARLPRSSKQDKSWKQHRPSRPWVVC